MSRARFQQALRLVLVSVMALALLTGCLGRPWLPQEGRVLDWETKEPIEGAVVVRRWFGDMFAFVETKGVCYHAESDITGPEGTYRIRFYMEGPSAIMETHPILSAYKVGYRESIDELGRYRVDKDMGVIYMEKDFSSKADRLEYVRKYHSACTMAGESEKNLLPLYRARYEEAKRLIELPDERWNERDHRSWLKHLGKILRRLESEAGEPTTVR